MTADDLEAVAVVRAVVTAEAVAGAVIEAGTTRGRPLLVHYLLTTAGGVQVPLITGPAASTS